MKIENPVKLTPEVTIKLEQAAAIDATWEECAFYAGISVATLYNWLESVDGLKERLEALRAKPILKARQTINSGLDQPENAKWYLERKRKTEFSPRHEHTGAEGKDLIPNKIVLTTFEDEPKLVAAEADKVIAEPITEPTDDDVRESQV
jgi:hypothetical protein